MSTSIELLRPREAGAPPASIPLNEAVWQAWVAKGRAQDRRRSARLMKAVKWVSVAVLLAAAGFWSQIAPFEVVVRSIVTAGALAVMIQAFQSRGYAAGAMFGVLALLFNPVVPVFAFAGDWQNAVVAAAVVPFAASLAWPSVRKARVDSRG